MTQNIYFRIIHRAQASRWQLLVRHAYTWLITLKAEVDVLGHVTPSD